MWFRGQLPSLRAASRILHIGPSGRLGPKGSSYPLSHATHALYMPRRWQFGSETVISGAAGQERAEAQPAATSN